MKIDALGMRQNDVEIELWGIERDKVRGGLAGRVDEQEDAIKRLDESMRRPPGWTTMVIIGGITSIVLSLINLATIMYVVARLIGG